MAAAANGDSAVGGEGVRRALERAEHADLKIVVLDATLWPDVPEASRALIDDAAILVLNKADLRTGPIPQGRWDPIPLSARSGQGVDRLVTELGRRAGARCTTRRPPRGATRRHAAGADTPVQS